MGLRTVWTRRKVLDDDAPLSTDYKAYSQLDLIAYSLNSTHAIGFHILIGILIANYAGPSACLSILIAMVAALLTGLCYAEFTARIPQRGNSYLYSYVSLGELFALVVGWTLVLEFVTGAACLSRALTSYIDFIFNGTIINFFEDIIQININYLSPYIDGIALVTPVIVAILLFLKIPSYPKHHQIAILINIVLAVTLIVIAGLQAHTSNWQEQIPVSIYESAQRDNVFNTKTAFLPYGMAGVFKGVPICLCAFFLVEYVSVVPKAIDQKTKVSPIVISLLVTAVGLCAVCIVVTLMIPYNQIQDEKQITTILPNAFKEIDLEWASWIALGSGIIALVYSIFIIMSPLPKLIYEMSKDCLIFHILGHSSDDFHPPIFGTLLFAVLSGLAGAFFSLNLLLNLISLGILLIFTFITAAVLILRYSDGRIERHNYLSAEINPGSCSNLVVTGDNISIGELCQQFFNRHKIQSPNPTTCVSVKINVILFCVCAIILNYCIVRRSSILFGGTIWMMILVGVVAILMICVLISIAQQPIDNRDLSYQVPLIPLLPAVSIFLNIHISLWIDWEIWATFGVWTLIGLCIYFLSLKLYKRCNGNTTNCLNRQAVHDRMNFAYDNRVSINEEVLPIPEEILTPIAFRKSMLETKPNGFVNQGFESDEEPSLDFTPPRISSATHVLEMFDKMISDSEKTCLEERESDEEDKVNRKVSIDSDYSTPQPIEHMVLVHSEDVITEEVPIEEEVFEEVTEEPLPEQYDELGDIQTLKTFTPKTPNVSRAESMRQDERPPNDTGFADKLNQLLQNQLVDKPRNLGLYKPEFYDDSEAEDTPRSSIKDGFLEMIHKELRERQKIKEQKSLEVETEPSKRDSVASEVSVAETPKDIRNKLEEIFKSGPLNPEEAIKTMKRPITLPPPPIPSFTFEDQNENPNETSDLAQQLRAQSMILAKVEKAPEIPNEQLSEPKIPDENRASTPDNASMATIRSRLDKILLSGLRTSIQPAPARPPSPKQEELPPVPEPHPKKSNIADLISSYNGLDLNANKTSTPRITNGHPVDLDETVAIHKQKMNNVFQNITLRRKDSGRSEGSFLKNLKNVNARGKYEVNST